MRVHHTGSSPAQESEIERARRGEKAEHSHHTHTGGHVEQMKSSDLPEAEISERARHSARAKAAAQGSPDVRPEMEAKLAALKQKIESNSYHPDENEIADKMVDDHIQMHGIG